MSEPTRRDFMQQAALAIPFLPLVLSESKAKEKERSDDDYYRLEPKWKEYQGVCVKGGTVDATLTKDGVAATYLIWNFGHGETHVFTPDMSLDI